MLNAISGVKLRHGEPVQIHQARRIVDDIGQRHPMTRVQYGERAGPSGTLSGRLGQGAGEAASLSLSLAESESHAILRPVDSYP